MDHLGGHAHLGLTQPARAGRHPPALVAMLCTGLLVGCSDDRLEVELIWEGEHVRLWRQVGSEVEPSDWCPATLPDVDAFTLELSALLDVQRSVEVNYVVLPGLEETGHECSGNSGCVRGSWVYTAHVPHYHEVVHAVRQSVASSPLFFEEGAASYLGDLGVTPGAGTEVRDDLLPAREVYDASWSRRLTLSEYEVAAGFYAFLVRDFGWELNRAFFERATQRTNRGATEAVFRDVFDEDVSTALDRYDEEAPRCSHEATRSPFFDCRADAIEVCDGAAPNRRVFDVDVSCGDGSTLGPRAGWIWQDVVFEVTHPGPHELVAVVASVDERPFTRVYAKRCSTDCEQADPMSAPIQVGENPVTPIDGIEEGRYVVRVYREEDAPGVVSVVWSCTPA